MINLKPPKALLEVKPQPYYPKILTIGLLYKILEPSPIDNCKALCGNKFKERHGISAVEDLMQDLTPHNLHLPQSDFDWLQLLAERTFMNSSSQLKNTTLINICEHLLDSSIFHALKHSMEGDCRQVSVTVQRSDSQVSDTMFHVLKQAKNLNPKKP